MHPVPEALVGDLRLYYEVAGEGPPVLYISGTGGDLRTAPGPFDSPLARRCTLAAYDQRGLGRSDKPDVAYTMADYADDAAGLLDVLGWEGVGVLGVSFGGMVAQQLVLRHPAKVGRLVLCCTSPGGGGGSSYPLHELESLPEEERSRRALALADVRFDEAWQAAHPDEVEAVLAYRRQSEEHARGDPLAATGARRQLEARAGHDTWDRLPQVACPTLVCGGRHDGIAPPANSEALASRIPRAELELYEGGHLFLLQDRAAWPRITEFLADP
jgi:3-oxoadipate enol-lactonase